MRRSVVIAGIVAVSMAVFPSAAFADQRPGAAVPAQPADCRPAGADPGGGSGTGDPATGGDRPATKPGTAGGGGEEPAAGGPGAEKPGSDEPAADKPDEEPGGDKSGGDKPGGEEPARSGGDEPSEQGGSAPASGSASGEGAGDDPPAGDGAGGDTSGGDEPAGNEPAGDEPAGNKPAGDEPAGNKPAGDEPAENKPAGDQPVGDEPAGDEPAGEKPAAGAGPDPCAAPQAPGAPTAPADPAAPAGAATSAAVMRDWGEPNRVEDFNGDLSAWSLYDGEGHAGQGRRSPEAASTKDGLLTINGDAEGTTAGMAWNPGQKYGRWEGRVRAPQSDPTYNALLLLWPDAENFPVGGEVDFMEMTDHLRQETELFLHYGEDNSQVQGKVAVDATQWHNWAVEWTPEKITAFVDGKEWWSTTDTSILPPGPMHLCIQLDWFPDNGKGGAVKPSEMQVDWVRQYPLPESEQGGGNGGKGAEGLLDGVGGALDHLTRRTEGAPDPVGSAQRGPSGVTGTP
ncbi:MAG: family 16 glycosylhydrolase [Actinomycetota bacterium]|nr:family 16 glycosylhydrolase [Actinomycetota bacterium]